MGFRIDGCGTYDKSKKLMHVGDYYCEKCKSVHPFYVCELVKKVTVLYVPVAKISSEYAVLCSKCESGYKLNDSQKARALAGDIGFITASFSNAEPPKETPPAPKPESTFLAAKPTPAIPHAQPGCCPRCGTPIDQSALFCKTCGRKYSEIEKSVPETQQAGFCEKCGSAVTSNLIFCTKCGNKLNK